MNEPRFGHALVIFKELICAVGGSLVSPSSAECFNFSTNQWTLLPPMITGKRNAAAVELNDELYVIGGSLVQDFDKVDFNIPLTKFITKTYYYSTGSNSALDSVEKYNSNDKSWTKVDSLLRKRMHPSAGVFNGKIYVIGSSDMIEAYDPVTKTWEMMDVLPENGSSYGRFSQFKHI